jgi:signal transduction histidine kinase
VRIPRPKNIRSRLTLWYLLVLAGLLLIYAALVFAFQYVVLTRQIAHDEIQDVETVEGLLYFNLQGTLQLRQDYYSRPQSHLLIDRMMEVRDSSDNVLYRSPTLKRMSLDGATRKGEGDASFDQRIIRLQDGLYVLVISHIHSIQDQELLIRLGYSLAPLRQRMLQFLLLLLLAVPIALALAGFTGQMIAKRALRPLERMTTRAESITASNLSSRLEVKNPDDELGQMARVINHLLDRLEQAFLHLQRFTSDAAHELRTPLASIRTIGEVALEKGHGSEEYREALGSILEEISRLNETIESLLLLTKAEATQTGNRQTTFIAIDLVNEVLSLLEVVIEERNVTVIQENDSEGKVEVRADRSLLRVAILNVLHNALKFSPNKSVLRISYSRTANTSTRLLIAFQDQGPGISAAEYQRVFDRFYTSSARATASQSGAGLGLSVAKLVIDRIGGAVWFDEQTQSGAMCIIAVPIFNESST